MLGDSYLSIRDEMRRAAAAKDATELVKFLSQMEVSGKDLMLALFYLGPLGGAGKEFKAICGNVLAEPIREANAGLGDALMNFSKQQDGVDALLKPNNGAQETVTTLVHHLKVIFLISRRKNQFVKALVEVSQDPRKAPYLPTMPQDMSKEVTDLLLKAGQTGVTRFYKCPEGHIYGIGDCGQPVEGGVCPDCKKAVGAGRRYAFHDGRNAEQVPHLEITDQTKQGHILGNAGNRRAERVEREQSPIEIAVTR